MNNKKIYREYAFNKIMRRLSEKNKMDTQTNIKVSCILDTFSYNCFKYEGDFYQLGINNWKDVIDRIKPNILLVESAWQGYNQEWINKIANMKIFRDNTLINITDYCKEKIYLQYFGLKKILMISMYL